MADVYMTLADMIDAGKIDDKAAMIAQRFRENSDVLNRLGFVNAPTGNYSWNEELSLPSSYWQGINASDPDADKALYQPHQVSAKMLRAKLIADNMVERRAQAQQSSTGTVASQARAHAKGMTYAAELALFEGDPTTAAAEPQGINSMCTLSSGNDQNLMYADGAGSAGAALTVSALEDLLDAVDGGANALMMSKPMRREVKKLFRDQDSITYQTEEGFTAKVMGYEGTPFLIIDKGVNRSEILGFDETVGSDTDCGSIYAVRFDMDGFFAIQDTPMEMLPPAQDGPFRKEWGFQWSLGFVAFRPNVVVRLAGIQAS